MSQNELKIAFRVIPLRHFGNGLGNHHCFGVGLRDGLYSDKGVLYLPNYADKTQEWVKALEYRINSSDSQNGAFRWVILSLIHESIHKTLLDLESDEICDAFDKIDKTDDANFKITEELQRNEKWGKIRG